jgi:hypothetical protein
MHLLQTPRLCDVHHEHMRHLLVRLQVQRTRVGQDSVPSREQQRDDIYHTARPPCRHFKHQSCCNLGSASEVAVFQP